MENKDFFILFLGWAFLFYLSNRNFKLTEISRSKDKLVDEITSIYDWYELSLRADSQSDSFTESRLMSFVARIQSRIQQFNIYADFNVIDSNSLIKLRSFDVTDNDGDNERQLREMNNIISDFVEQVENSYDVYMQNSRNVFMYLWLYKRPKLLSFIKKFDIAFKTYQTKK